tara:strand:+ start:1542 stop:2150 length:609 start_codon:yes stop_codon:yes gene_type:complete
MANFCKLDSNNVVTDLYRVSDIDCSVDGVENEAKGVEFLRNILDDQTANIKKYSMWTVGNGRFANAPSGDPYRGNAAKIGGTYDPANDVFINPKPFDSWVLDGNYQWQPPVTEPTEEQRYYGSDPFESILDPVTQRPVNPTNENGFIQGINYVTVTNTDGDEITLPENRIPVQWDEENQVWWGWHNDGSKRNWNGTAWSPSL